MRERPILMSAPMVRAILAGTKTQTRRVVKYEVTGPNHPNTLDFRLPGTPPANGKLSRVRGWQGALDATTRKGNALNLCPYGVPGDRLWVRETWAKAPPCVSMKPNVAYRADYHPPLSDFPPGGALPDGERRWRPSIHMPRWASRITLEITDVRVERLQEISQSDAMAEGAPLGHRTIDVISRECGYADFSRSWYAQLWDSINGAGSWDANPWVWALTFRRIGDA